LSPEGVVLGADSTSTYQFGAHPHHFNFGQKIFEIGHNSTLGIVTWGLGGLALGSYRTLIARLSDQLTSSPVSNVDDVASQWASLFWAAYSTSQSVLDFRTLAAKAPHDPANPADPLRRTADQEKSLPQIKDNLVVGFCIAGYMLHTREPVAAEIIFDPSSTVAPAPQRLSYGHSYWGVPAFINRLISGCADEVRDAICASGKWNGTRAELDAVINTYRLVHPTTVPIREAIDFTHACILSTIKAIKFSQLPPVCGGPIEIAVITTDRPYRWVMHKDWDAAIREGRPWLNV
jgi:hypothetical protein